jgi:hypothetical protein
MANITIQQVTKENLPKLKGPLAVLTKEGLSILKYPSNLGNKADSNEKNHWVTFRIFDIEPAGIREANTGLADTTQNNTVIGLNAGSAGLAAAAAVAIPGAILANGVRKGTVSKTDFLKVAAVGTGIAAVAGLVAATGFTVTPPTGSTKSIISLYMPDSLVARYDAQYDEMSLTKDLGAAITTLRAIDSTIQDPGGGNGITGSPAAVQAAISGSELTGARIPGVEIGALGTLLQRAQGYALNPQLQMVYRGTGLRTFQLSFTFTPKSAKEAQDVNNIINQFRFYASPSLGQRIGGQIGATTNSMFLVPPSLFELEFYVNGKPSEYLPRYGRCILDNLDINHAPNGFAAYGDGSMVQTTLELSFKEMDILTRDSFIDEENPRR